MNSQIKILKQLRNHFLILFATLEHTQAHTKHTQFDEAKIILYNYTTIVFIRSKNSISKTFSAFFLFLVVVFFVFLVFNTYTVWMH